MSKYLAEIGRKGGLKGGRKKVPKGTAALTPEERSELGRKAAKKRWEDEKKAKAGGRERKKTK